MTDHSNFLNIIQSSPALSERWSELTQKAIADAREQHGVTITPNDIVGIRELRNAALGAPLDPEAYASELLESPALSDAARRKEIESGDEDARAATIAEVNRLTDDVNPHRRGEAAARKLSRAREMGVATAPAAAPDDRKQKLELLSQIDDHRTRLRMGRQWNLI